VEAGDTHHMRNDVDTWFLGKPQFRLPTGARPVMVWSGGFRVPGQGPRPASPGFSRLGTLDVREARCYGVFPSVSVRG
jgi:hypothetical protein